MGLMYLTLFVLGILMIATPEKILKIMKGPLVPEHSPVKVIWLHRLRYIGWFVLAAGIFGLINLYSSFRGELKNEI